MFCTTIIQVQRRLWEEPFPLLIIFYLIIILFYFSFIKYSAIFSHIYKGVSFITKYSYSINQSIRTFNCEFNKSAALTQLILRQNEF